MKEKLLPKFCHAVVNATIKGKPIKSRATIAAYNVEDTPNTFVYAISWTAPQDQFCKAEGRRRAAGRLQSMRFAHVIHVANTNSPWISILDNASIYAPATWENVQLSFFKR